MQHRAIGNLGFFGMKVSSECKFMNSIHAFEMKRARIFILFKEGVM